MSRKGIMTVEQRLAKVRPKSVEVHTARRRKSSSTRWLKRQLNDPYVLLAQQEGMRSRAAYKLLEIDEKCDILRRGRLIVDLGAAPGSWVQAAIEATGGNAQIIALDMQDMEPIANVDFIKGDFLEDSVLHMLQEKLGGRKVDLVMSDMAAASCGHPATDHDRIMALLEVALDFAYDHLAPGGDFVAKVLRGGTEQKLLSRMKQCFDTVKHIKPAASRSDSAEMYVIAQGYKKL